MARLKSHNLEVVEPRSKRRQSAQHSEILTLILMLGEIGDTRAEAKGHGLATNGPVWI